MVSAVFGPLSGGVPDCVDQQDGVEVVEAADGAAEVDGDAARKAGR